MEIKTEIDNCCLMAGKTILMMLLLLGMGCRLYAVSPDTLALRASKRVICYDTLVRRTVQLPAEDQRHYTIQICTLSVPLTDPLLRGKYSIKQIRIGDLYRYIFSMYCSLQAAQQDLPKVQKVYPGAFIREFDENKLGKAVDLKIDHLK